MSLKAVFEGCGRLGLRRVVRQPAQLGDQSRSSCPTRTSGWSHWLQLGGIVLICAACSSSLAGGRTPQQTLDDYATALQHKDAKRAYALLSAEAQRRLPFARFEAMMLDNPAEVQQLVRALQQPTRRMVVTATLQDSGESLDLVLEDGEWKANLSAIDLYSQMTPLSTLNSFVRAFEARRYDVLMRFVPDAEKEGLSAETLKTAWEGAQKQEMFELIEALKASLPTAKAEQYANTATVAYGAAGTVALVQEHGLWKIVNF